MRALKAVLFDLGSTLVEFEYAPWDQVERISLLRGYDCLVDQGWSLPPAEHFVEMVTGQLRQAFIESSRTLVEFTLEAVVEESLSQLGLPTSDGLISKFLLSFYRPITDHVRAFEDAFDTLNLLKRRELGLGLVSNTIFPGGFHRAELERFKLADFLDCQIFSRELGYKKPHPMIFRAALDLLGIAASEAIFVGDRLLEDVEGPHRVGMKAILKEREGRDYSPDVAPDGRISRLAELPEVLETLDL